MGVYKKMKNGLKKTLGKKVLGDRTNTANEVASKKARFNIKRGKKNGMISCTTTVENGSSSNNNNNNKFTPVEILDVFADNATNEGEGLNVTRTSSSESSLDEASSSLNGEEEAKSSRDALEAWVTKLGSKSISEEEEKEEVIRVLEEEDSAPTKENDDVVFSSNVVSAVKAASSFQADGEEDEVEFDLSESEFGGSPIQRISSLVVESVVDEEVFLGDVDEVEEEKALESYLFTPKPPAQKKEHFSYELDTPPLCSHFLCASNAPNVLKKATQSTRLSLAMWDLSSISPTPKILKTKIMKNMSAMDLAMAAGAMAVVLNFFMPSFLRATF